MRSPAPARVLILSDREVAPAISRTGTFEFEDLASSVDSVDIIGLGPLSGRVERKLERFVPGAFRAPAKLRRDRPYDLLFASFHSLPELARLHPISAILKLARHTVINIDELWCTTLLRYSGDLATLRAFDQIYTPCAGALELLRSATGRPCDYLAPSVDALRFGLGTRPVERSIDIHLMGRRRADLHRALADAAERSDRFYYYDSIQMNPPQPNYIEHRVRLADLVRRTRFFVVDIANSDVPEKRGVQEEFGPRFVEGAAGGAIMIGRAPKTPIFESQFWPGAVQRIGDDGASIANALDELEAQPEKLAQMRRHSAVQVLRRHDGSYRWEQILRSGGIEPLPALVTRRRELDRLASAIELEDKEE